eukprot:2416904-Pleurochrysis_carterae.AAC.1
MLLSLSTTRCPYLVSRLAASVAPPLPVEALLSFSIFPDILYFHFHFVCHSPVFAVARQAVCISSNSVSLRSVVLTCVPMRAQAEVASILQRQANGTIVLHNLKFDKTVLTLTQARVDLPSRPVLTHSLPS